MTAAERLNERMSALDIEIMEVRAQGKVALDVRDIQARYGISEPKAYKIIRGIKHVCGGGLLPGAKILPSELARWESLPKEHFVNDNISEDWGNPMHSEIPKVKESRMEEKSKFVTVYVKEPWEGVRSQIVVNEPGAFRELVGGHIRSVTMFGDMSILCNDDGKLKGLTPNCNICGYDFYGTIVFVGKQNDDFCDVPIKFDLFKKILPAVCG